MPSDSPRPSCGACSSAWGPSDMTRPIDLCRCAVMLVAGWIGLATWTTTAAPDDGLVSVRGLVTRLARAGRAEARITRSQADAMTGTNHSLSGRLALESP